MANQNVPRPVAETPDFEAARHYYAIIREQQNETGAVANALERSQEPDTHAYHLAQLLDSRMADAEFWHKLDNYFGVDHNGEPVEANHA